MSTSCSGELKIHKQTSQFSSHKSYSVYCQIILIHLNPKFCGLKTMDMFVDTWIQGFKNIRNNTKVIFYKDLKFVDVPTHGIHKIKCPTNKNDFTAALYQIDGDSLLDKGFLQSEGMFRRLGPHVADEHLLARPSPVRHVYRCRPR